MGTIIGDDGDDNQIGGAPGATWIACGRIDDTFGIHECFEWFLAPYRFGDSPVHGLPEKSSGRDQQFMGMAAWRAVIMGMRRILTRFRQRVFLWKCPQATRAILVQTLRSPGDYPQVLTTGACDDQNRIVSVSWSYWWGSSRGPAALSIPGAPDFIKPEIVAPGYDIRSAYPGGSYVGGWGGTSMAGPLTAATVALLWSAAPGYRSDIQRTRDLIIDSAYTNPGDAGYWDQTCQGINANVSVPEPCLGMGASGCLWCISIPGRVFR